MPSLKDIRKAVAEVLQAGLEGVNVHEKIVPTVTCPAVEIKPDSTVNVAFKRGVVECVLSLFVSTDGEDAQDQLDDIISGTTNSIPAIIHASPTAGQNASESVAASGVTFTISDQGVQEYGAEVIDGVYRKWQARYQIKVLARGDV